MTYPRHIAEDEFESAFAQARLLRLKRHYPEAIHHCSSLLAEYELTERQRIVILTFRAGCYTVRRQYVKAEQDLRRAEQLCGETRRLDLAYVLITQARLRISQKHVYSARDHIARAEHLLSTCAPNDTRIRLEAATTSLKGVLFTRESVHGRWHHALTCFIEAEKIFQAHNDPVRRMRNLRRLCYTLARTGKRQRARKEVEGLIWLAQRLPEPFSSTGGIDTLSEFVGKWIRACVSLPLPTRITLWPIKRWAGL